MLATAIDEGRPRRGKQKTTERSAAEVAMHGTVLERARLAAQALVDLMRDPEDTSRVFVLGLAVSAAHYPTFLARLTFDDRGARLLRERPAIDTKHVDFAWLRSLPADTLGGAYARFVDANRLDPDLFQRPPGLPDVPAYVSQRMRQVHDIWHVLTGYDADVRGEIALQAFTYGNVGFPSSALIVLGGILRYGLSHPDAIALVADAYRRGKKAAFLAPVWLEEMWERPLEDVRRELGIEPVSSEGGPETR